MMRSPASKKPNSPRKRIGFDHASSETKTPVADSNPLTENTQENLQDIADHSPINNQVSQLQSMANQASSPPNTPKTSNTGIPSQLKNGIEQLSGYSLDDVRVNYNSSKPAQLQALAYAQGTEIHLGPGQEKHLPHEAWHVVQQKQGRVKPTRQVNGTVNINDSSFLEQEADVMGAKALMQMKQQQNLVPIKGVVQQIVQRIIMGLEDIKEPNDIDNTMVDAFLADILDDHAHLFDEDIIAYLGANVPDWDKETKLKHSGNHWDVVLGKEPEILVTTKPDGNCGVHAIDVIMNRASFKSETKDHVAQAPLIAQVRQWIRARTAKDRNEIKKKIYSVLGKCSILAETGFGPQLTAILQAVIQKSASDQTAASGASLAGSDVSDDDRSNPLDNDNNADGKAAAAAKASGRKKRGASKKSKAVTEEEDIVETFMAKAKVGLELTFNSNESKKYLGNGGFPSDHKLKQEAIAWWSKMLGAWTGGMEPPNEGWLVHRKEAGQNKDFGNGTGSQKMVKLLYNNASNITVFWWQLSMDPQVVEIQTSPVTANQMREGEYEAIINDIFDRAADLKFTAGGGGGHLNVDFVSGFKGDFSLLPKLLDATETVIDGLRRLGNDDEQKDLVDFGYENEDPFIGTDRVEMKPDSHGNWDSKHDPRDKGSQKRAADWKTEVGQRSINDQKSLEAFRDAHAKWLFLHPTLSQYMKAGQPNAKITEKGDEATMKQVLHYQAVNIDHLFDKLTDDSDPRRLEFRFFKGQSSVDEIVAGIKLIGQIYERALKMK